MFLHTVRRSSKLVDMTHLGKGFSCDHCETQTKRLWNVGTMTRPVFYGECCKDGEVFPCMHCGTDVSLDEMTPDEAAEAECESCQRESGDFANEHQNEIERDALGWGTL